MMLNNTEVFKDFEAFRNRPDTRINGVSPEFAEKHPDYQHDNETNTGCWDCLNCIDCIDCDTCVQCTECDYCTGCANCFGLTSEEDKLGN